MADESTALVDRDQLATYLELDTERVAELDSVVGAVDSLIRQWNGGPENADDWPAHMRHGAMMLAAKVYRRRNSPGGVEAMNELGVAYVQRNDPDLAMLLGLGGYTTPRVG